MSREFKNRTCKGICKKFEVKKQGRSGRYIEGQARCQICEVWISYKGCHFKDGTPASVDSLGWFCNCCNYRVRTRPRNKAYKEKLIQKLSEDSLDSNYNGSQGDQFDSSEMESQNDFVNTKNSDQPIIEVKTEDPKNNFWKRFKRIIAPKTTFTEKDNKMIIQNEGKNSEKEKLHSLNNSGNSKVSESNYVSNQGKQNFDLNDYIIKNEAEKLIQNLKDEKKHSLEKKEDFVNAYFHFGSIRKVMKATNQTEETIRMYTQTSKRLPQKLRDAHNKSILSMDPKLSLNIALHATDFYKWDGEKENQEKAYDLALQIAKYIKKSKL